MQRNGLQMQRNSDATERDIYEYVSRISKIISGDALDNLSSRVQRLKIISLQ